MKKARLFPLLLFPLVMTSCGSSKFLGTYSFQLGKNTGTHIGVYATVTNKAYTYEDASTGETLTIGKKMNIRMRLGGVKLGTFLDDIDLSDVTIPAYYMIGKELPFNQGNVLHLGFHIPDVLNILFPEEPEPETNPLPNRDDPVDPAEPSEPTDPTDPTEPTDPESDVPEGWDDPTTIPTEITARFVYTTISSTTLTFNLPVSLLDLQFQLYWYGLDLYDISARPAEHEVGTHPTKEEIDYINNELGYASAHDDTAFRDYHTLSLALSKK